MNVDYTVMSLCTGVGGLDLGIRIAVPGARSVCMVEREAYAAAVLGARMEEGWLHPAPIWLGDIGEFDPGPWRGRVHCVASGDPCQPNSVAGKRKGADDDRWLIDQVLRIIKGVRPDRFFRENVAGNADGQLAALVPPLEAMGYRVAAGIFARQKWEQATAESACSSWPTARVTQGGYTRDNGDPAKERTSLEGLAEQWETPSVAVTEGSRLTRGGKRSNEMLLTGQAMAVSEAKDWATPCARDHFPPHTAEYIAGKKAQGHGMRNLVDEATAWPTPAARATKGANSADHLENGTGRKHLDQLPNFVSHCLPPDHPTRSGPKSSNERRTLNPLFVEWLMGWPIGWTALEPVAMAWSHYRQLTHGELSKLVSKNPERTLFGEIAA